MRMKVRFLAIIGAMGVLGAGCQSQEAHGASLSLKRDAANARHALYDEVELIAGSGAEEDEPLEQEEEAEPDAGVDERVQERLNEELGWSDDSGLCGNGVIDADELCDYAILEGEGMCPEECNPAPGCPDETLVVRGCMTHCMQHEEPSAECLPAEQP
jgi:hypothetical protein